MMRMIEQNFKHSLNLPLQSQANLMPCLQDSQGRVGHGNFRKLFNPIEEKQVSIINNIRTGHNPAIQEARKKSQLSHYLVQ